MRAMMQSTVCDQPGSRARRSWRGRVPSLVLIGALTTFGATPLEAQRDSVVRIRPARAHTPFERRVERLSRELFVGQREVIELFERKAQLTQQLRDAGLDEAKQSQIEHQLRRVDNDLATLEMTNQV